MKDHIKITCIMEKAINFVEENLCTVLTPEQVGASKSYLLHAGLSDNGTVITKRAIIKQSTLIRGSRTA